VALIISISAVLVWKSRGTRRADALEVVKRSALQHRK